MASWVLSLVEVSVDFYPWHPEARTLERRARLRKSVLFIVVGMKVGSVVNSALELGQLRGGDDRRSSGSWILAPSEDVG